MTKLFGYTVEVRNETASVVNAADRIQARNRLLAKRFDEDVVAAGWRRLRKGDTFMPPGHALVVGAVTWSTGDLPVLADLAIRSLSLNLDVYVFNLDDVHSAEDLEKFMPGVPLPTTTPVIAEYHGSGLLRSAQGVSAIDVIASLQHPSPG